MPADGRPFHIHATRPKDSDPLQKLHHSQDLTHFQISECKPRHATLQLVAVKSLAEETETSLNTNYKIKEESYRRAMRAVAINTRH